MITQHLASEHLYRIANAINAAISDHERLMLNESVPYAGRIAAQKLICEYRELWKVVVAEMDHQSQQDGSVATV